MRRVWVGAILGVAALLLSGAAAAVAGVAPAAARPADEELRGITEGGRRIASYQEAIVTARKRFEEKTDLGDRIRPVVVDRKGVWHVVFISRGPQEGDLKAWLVVADAVFRPRAGEVERFDLVDPPKPAPTDAQTAMRAIETARAGAQAHAAAVSPPFAESVFRDKSGTFTVYLQSRTGARAFVRFGCDLKATVSADGNQVLQMAPLHGPGESTDVAPGDGRTPTLHSHARGDLPTETDVALVVESPGVAPHLVLTPSWIFRIESDGAVTWLGRNEVPPVAPGGGM
jgi:hypothetical protein